MLVKLGREIVRQEPATGCDQPRQKPQHVHLAS
jgi:hypothetical protein